ALAARGSARANVFGRRRMASQEFVQLVAHRVEVWTGGKLTRVLSEEAGGQARVLGRERQVELTHERILGKVAVRREGAVLRVGTRSAFCIAFATEQVAEHHRRQRGVRI